MCTFRTVTTNYNELICFFKDQVLYYAVTDWFCHPYYCQFWTHPFDLCVDLLKFCIVKQRDPVAAESGPNAGDRNRPCTNTTQRRRWTTQVVKSYHWCYKMLQNWCISTEIIIYDVQTGLEYVNCVRSSQMWKSHEYLYIYIYDMYAWCVLTNPACCLSRALSMSLCKNFVFICAQNRPQLVVINEEQRLPHCVGEPSDSVPI